MGRVDGRCSCEVNIEWCGRVELYGKSTSGFASGVFGSMATFRWVVKIFSGPLE